MLAMTLELGWFSTVMLVGLVASFAAAVFSGGALYGMNEFEKIQKKYPPPTREEILEELHAEAKSLPLTHSQLASCIIGGGDICPRCGEVETVDYGVMEFQVDETTEDCEYGEYYQLCKCSGCDRSWRLYYKPSRAIEVDPKTGKVMEAGK